MTPMDLVHTFLQNASERGLEYAKNDLERKRNFISFSKDELIFATEEAVSMALNDGGAKWFYYFIILISVTSFVLSFFVVITPSHSDIVRLVFCGLTGLSGVLIIRYAMFLGEPKQRASRVRVICNVLLDLFDLPP